MSLYGLRQRMPLPVFIVVLAIALVLAGFACACLSDHPLQALERLVVALAAEPFPLLDAWAFAAVFAFVFLASQSAPHRFTQAHLQRFRF